MKHILKTLSDNEVDGVKHATENIKFVASNCFGNSGVSNNNLP